MIPSQRRAAQTPTTEKSSDRKAETVLPICQRKPKAVMSKSKVIEKKRRNLEETRAITCTSVQNHNKISISSGGGGHESPSEEAVLAHEPLMGTTTPC